MKTRNLFVLYFLISSICLHAQEPEPLTDTIRQGALNLYMQVSDHVRQEINYVNYVREIREADVYVIRTTQPTGAGGTEHTFFFNGQRRFAGMADTLRFTAYPDDTSDAVRRKEIQTLHMGLMRYVAKTPLARYMEIRFSQPVSQTVGTDRWNSWVFSTSLSGFLNGQKTYDQNHLFGRFSANRVTETSKLETSLSYNRSEDNFLINDTKYNSINSSRSARVLYVHSLGNHWSAGGSTSISSSSFNNIGRRFTFLPGIEYNIFPYAESTRRQFRILYRIGLEYNNYIDTTIYNKTEETLGMHSLLMAYEVVQKWGSVNLSCSYRNYLHDFSKRNLGLNAFMSIRLFRGLSFNMGGGVSLLHDQLALVKGGASTEEILLRRKELETQYRYFTSFGLTYTFGSIYTNVVNPRFGSGGGSSIVISF
jgi:hypothetical protein